MASEGPAIGIDLGTTYSCVAVWHKDSIQIIPNDQGNRITPSYVGFTDTHRLIGDAAKNQAGVNPRNTIFDAKRLIGRRFSEEVVQKDIKLWPFKVTAAANDKPMINVQYKGEQKTFAAEEISAIVLTKMKEAAEAFLGTTVKNAVITVPAKFNHSQRQATRDAGAIAGLNVLKIISEPSAAAIAYGLHKNKALTSGRVLVFDLGGGTFDVSILTMKDESMEVKAVAGDPHLGGEDFDNRIVEHFIKEFQRMHKKDIRDSPRALRRLRTECEKAKRVLSATIEAPIEIECLYDGIDFSSKLSRAKFEQLNKDLFEECLGLVRKCLDDANMDKRQIGDIVLVGGSTRIPKVQELLQSFFNGKELHRNIHADEAVAYGAAVQAASLGKMSMNKELVLSDVTPLSLGVETNDGLMSILIPRNTTVPAKSKHVFTIVEDNQTRMRLPVYEGERTLAKDNHMLGAFTLSGLPPAPRGKLKVKVQFNIDVNGILTVSAKHKKQSNKIIIRDIERSQTEIQKMILDAENNRVEDEKYKKMVEKKNLVENSAYNIRAILQKDNGALDVKVKTELEGSVNRIIKWLSENKDVDVEFMIKVEEFGSECRCISAQIQETSAHRRTQLALAGAQTVLALLALLAAIAGLSLGV